MRRIDPGRLLLLALLALAASVTLARAVRLAADPPALDGRDERRWLGWAWRDPGLPGRLAEAGKGMADGERVLVVIRKGQDPAWVGVMARYALPRQEVDVRARGQVGRVPPGTTVLRITWKGEVQVRRPGNAG